MLYKFVSILRCKCSKLTNHINMRIENQILEIMDIFNLFNIFRDIVNAFITII